MTQETNSQLHKQVNTSRGSGSGKGDPQEVANEHTSPSLKACSVGLKDSPGSPNQEEILGAELVVKGSSHKVYNSSHSKPCKCGHQQPQDRSFPHNLKRKDEYKYFLCKTGLCKPPTLPEKIGEGDHNFYKERKWAR